MILFVEVEAHGLPHELLPCHLLESVQLRQVLVLVNLDVALLWLLEALGSWGLLRADRAQLDAVVVQ